VVRIGQLFQNLKSLIQRKLMDNNEVLAKCHLIPLQNLDEEEIPHSEETDGL